MRVAYRQHDGGPIVNLARHPRGTAFLATGQFPKWQNSRWAADGTYTTYTGLAGHPEGITTGVRFTVTTPRNGHGLEISGNVEASTPELTKLLPAGTPGERITVSCWLRYTGPAVQVYQMVFRPTVLDGSAWLSGNVASANFALPSGAWVRLSQTYTVPPGAGFVAFMVRNSSNNVNDAAGDQIDGTGLMVTRTAPPQGANIATDPYATRVTPNGVWAWAAQWFGQGGTGTTVPIADATDGPNGIKTYLRKTWTAIGTNLSNVAFNHGVARANPGDQVTVRSWVRASKGWTLDTLNYRMRMSFQWRDATNTQIGSTASSPNINIPGGVVAAGVWYPIEFTATAPAGTVSVFVYQDVSMPLSAWAVGDTIDGTGLVVTQNPTRWRFADGSSPGWRWLGAANTSESAGYAQPG